MSARVTSHVLDAVSGTHAAGLPVRLVRLSDGAVIHDGATDAGGRLAIEVGAVTPGESFELVFGAAAYWRGRGVPATHPVSEVVLRFAMPDPAGRYHMPVILSPNGHASWASTPDG